MNAETVDKGRCMRCGAKIEESNDSTICLRCLPLRLPIQDVYSITGIGTVPVGRVETGLITVGDTVVFEPAGVSGEVKSIEMNHENIPQAGPGDNIGFHVSGVGKTDIRRGDVCGHPENPPTVAKEFTAQIVILQHPSAITAGYTPVFHIHTSQVACKITQLISRLDSTTTSRAIESGSVLEVHSRGTILEKAPKALKAGDAGVIRVEPTRPMVVEKVKDIPQMSRFVIRDMGSTVAVGLVVDITPDPPYWARPPRKTQNPNNEMFGYIIIFIGSVIFLYSILTDISNSILGVLLIIAGALIAKL